MERACKQCQTSFEVTGSDMAFYDKVSPIVGDQKLSLPPPTLCPPCRRQRRLAFRNERHLYRRRCDLCKAEVVSVYAPDAPYKAFCTSCWWSDRWDPLSFGRAFDPQRPFFEQYRELLLAVPKITLMHMHSENAEYVAYSIHYKNSYMCVSGVDGESLLYTYYVSESKDCTDCSILYRSELCYECTCGDHLYHCISCFDCESASDAILCFDCKNCRNCIGCVGLRGKQYCVLNAQRTKEEYEGMARSFQEDYAKTFSALLPKVLDLKLRHPHLHAILTNSEDSTGHLLYNSRNARECFECTDLEDCAYCTNILYSKDCCDCHYLPNGELMLEVVSSNQPSRQCFCYTCWESHDLLYCYECMNCRDCFGCVGLRKKRYCIFNTQYTKEGYEELAPRIVARMRDTKEYGEYFPVQLSTFAYNESVSSEEFPLTKEEVQERGWQWEEQIDEPAQVAMVFDAHLLPDTIDAVPDDILNWAIRCEVTKRPFRIVKQELQFYRKLQLPIPHLHPDERYRRRMALRNPRRLWPRACAKCSKPIQTTYAPERSEKVVCEACYLQAVY